MLWGSIKILRERWQILQVPDRLFQFFPSLVEVVCRVIVVVLGLEDFLVMDSISHLVCYVLHACARAIAITIESMTPLMLLMELRVEASAPSWNVLMSWLPHSAPTASTSRIPATIISN